MLRVEESADDGRFEISSGAPSGKADANSVLKLVFEFPDDGMIGAIPGKWTDLDELVQRLEERFNIFTELRKGG